MQESIRRQLRRINQWVAQLGIVRILRGRQKPPTKDVSEMTKNLPQTAYVALQFGAPEKAKTFLSLCMDLHPSVSVVPLSNDTIMVPRDRISDLEPLLVHLPHHRASEVHRRSGSRRGMNHKADHVEGMLAKLEARVESETNKGSAP